MHTFSSRQIAPPQVRLSNQSPTVCIVDPKLVDCEDWRLPANADRVQFKFVPSAEEALRIARTTAVVLWAVSTELAGLSGFELCSILKASSPSAPVYLAADDYSPEAERAAYAARATLFASKAQLSKCIEGFLAC
jgi:CheY-like chemotaxis protein